MKFSTQSKVLLSICMPFTFLFLVGCSPAANPKEDASLPKENIDTLFKEANESFRDSNYDLARGKLEVIQRIDIKSQYKDSISKMLVLIDTIFQQNIRLAVIEKEKQDKAEKAKQAAALNKMSKKKDEFKEVTWYQDKTSPSYRNRNGFYGYIGVSKGSPSLRLVIQYSGEEWLFIEKYIIKVGDQTFEITENSYGEIESDNDSDVWEWLDRYAGEQEKQIMKAVAYGKSAKMRIEGKQYYKDRTITPQQQLALRNVLEAYQALGGTL